MTAVHLVHCSNDCCLTPLFIFRTVLSSYCIIRLTDICYSNVNIWFNFVGKNFLCLIKVFSSIIIVTLLNFDDALTQIMIVSTNVILSLMVKTFIFIGSLLVATEAEVTVGLELTKKWQKEVIKCLSQCFQLVEYFDGLLKLSFHQKNSSFVEESKIFQ
jgi:ABC-type protease/lipase transport system fused ATPase/permease subunit